jgi:hydrogenase maturation protease
VIGCGNPYAGDDAAGLEVVAELRERALGRFDFREMNQLAPGDLAGFPDCVVVVFIDAVESGVAAGTIHVQSLTAQSLRSRNLESISTHGFGLRHELELARTLKAEIPKLVLIGIEAASCNPGEAMSRPVQQAVRELVSNFDQYCERAVALL